MATKPEVLVSIRQAAEYIGVTHSAVQNWIKDEGFPVLRNDIGRGGAKISMPAVFEWWGQRVVGKELSWAKAKIADLEGDKKTNVSTHDLEATKLTAARRAKTEMETAVMAGKLVSYDDFVASASEAMLIVGSRDDGMAGRLAAELAQISDAAVIRKTLLDELRKHRAEAAIRLTDWALAGLAASGGNVAPATEPDAGPVG
jgi:phage terminase Nu1 subunit (DNA packaging protein)